ncbi:MAG: hypothetical protein R6X02_05170 [Enhygromyxa sp.]
MIATSPEQVMSPDGTWSLADRRLGDALVLSAVDCELAVADIYRRVIEPDANA